MQEEKFGSPKVSKKGNNASSSSLVKDKQYLPSRYALDNTKQDSKMTNLLNSISVLIQPLNSILATIPSCNLLPQASLPSRRTHDPRRPARRKL